MRVLAADDKDNLPQLTRVFDVEGRSIFVTHDGESLVQAARQDEYDIIFLSNDFYRVSVLDAIQKLRRDRNITPIVVTGRPRHGDWAILGQILDAGADGFVRIPSSEDRIPRADFEKFLVQYMQRTAERCKKPSYDGFFQLEGITLNSDLKKVKIGRKGLNLTRSEYKVFEFLALNFGKTVSEEQLASHVYEDDQDPLNSLASTSNTIAVFVGRLRKKIAKEYNGLHPIHTIRGEGYKMTDQFIPLPGYENKSPKGLSRKL